MADPAAEVVDMEGTEGEGVDTDVKDTIPHPVADIQTWHLLARE